MKKVLALILALALCVSLCACGKTTDEYGNIVDKSTAKPNKSQKSDTSMEVIAEAEPEQEEDPLLEVEALLQGSWECYNEEHGFGEIFVFDNGQLKYTSYVSADRSKDHVVYGTYRVTEDNVITTLSDYNAYLDYAVSGGRLSLSWYIDSGADGGETRVYIQKEKGKLDPSYNPGSGTPSPQPPATEGKSSPSNSSSVTTGQREALESAQSYLRFMAFSYEGLIDQLKYEGFTSSEAQYAVDHCGADWYEQAVLCAEAYLEYMDFSRSELIDQLEYEGFTHDQAVHGVDRAY